MTAHNMFYVDRTWNIRYIVFLIRLLFTLLHALYRREVRMLVV